MSTVSTPRPVVSPEAARPAPVSGAVLVGMAVLALGVLPVLFVLPHDRVVLDANLPLLAWLPLGLAGVLVLDRSGTTPTGWAAALVAAGAPLAMLLTSLPAEEATVASGPGWLLPLLAVAAAALPAEGRAARRWRLWIVLWSVAAVVVSYAAWALGSPTTFGVVAALGLLAVAGAVAGSALAPAPRPPLEPLLDAGLLLGVLAAGVAAGGIVWSFAVHERIFGAEVVGALAAAVTLMLATPAAVFLRRTLLARRYGTGLLSPQDLALLTGDLAGRGDPRTLLATANELVAAASGAERVEIVLDDPDERAGWTSLPLVVGEERVGTMCVRPRDPEGLEARQELVVRQLAPTVALAAHAVELAVQAKHAHHQVIAERQIERARILADLHDDLGPALAGIGMRVEAARATGVAVDLGALATDLAACRADLRRIVSALTPEPLVSADLDRALAALVTSFRTDDGPAVTIDARVGEQVDGTHAIVAYRCVAEAVTNALRHAGANHVGVRVQQTEDALTVTVVDDGRGAPVVPGVGLTSMAARAREVGGRLDIGPAESGGLRVMLVVPRRSA